MSKYEDRCTVAFPRARMVAACRVAVEKLGWRVLRQNDVGIVCAEPPPQNPLSFTTPVEVEIGVFGSASDNETTVIFKGSNQGLGPIQSSHVKSQVARLMQELGKAAVTAPETVQPPIAAATATPQVETEPGKRSVLINGSHLSDDQIDILETAYRVRIQDGNYWYDPLAGGWGFRGGPTAGVMQAGLSLGGHCHRMLQTATRACSSMAGSCPYKILCCYNRWSRCRSGPAVTGSMRSEIVDLKVGRCLATSGRTLNRRINPARESSARTTRSGWL